MMLKSPAWVLSLMLVGCLVGFLMLTKPDRSGQSGRTVPDPIDEWEEVPQRDPLTTFLQSIEGTQILFFSTAGCAPCAAREKDTIPWMEERGWQVRKIVDPELAEMLGVTSYPTFVAVRNHRIAATSNCRTRREATAFLKAAKGDSLEHVAVALAAHLQVQSPATSSGSRSSGRFAPDDELPAMKFPFGPSVSLLDVFQKYGGQEIEVCWFVKVSIPKGIRWQATPLKNCMHLDFQPAPSLRFFGREVARLTAIDVTFESVGLVFDGFPDFTVPVTW